MIHICTRCGYEGKGKKILRGSRGMEIFIWAVLMFPGPFYSLWRRIGVRRRCPHCETLTMVSLNSDEGLLAHKRLELEVNGSSAVASKPTPQPQDMPPTPHETPRPKQKIDPNVW